MNQQEFYGQQSYITDPQTYAELFDAVPDDIESICKASRNVVNHYFGDPRHKPPKERWTDIDTRYVSKMLERVIELDDCPLMEERSNDNRFVGCCRDFTALTVAIMRHKGIPARSRYGTAVYFEKPYYWDHVIAEYWNGERWVGVDAQLSHNEERQWNFDIRDVPPDQFLVGGRGWQLVREGREEARMFGLGSMRGGLEFIIVEMMLDLAALNREEHLCWEAWGYSNQDYNTFTEEDCAFLDKVAAATVDANFEQCRELFKHPKLAIPSQIVSFTPAAADPSQYPIPVTLK